MEDSKFEMLEVEEYAERLHVSRATIFSWLKQGILKPGRHCMRSGRVLRFKWSEAAIDQLMEDMASSKEEMEYAQAPKQVTNIPPAVRQKTQINFAY